MAYITTEPHLLQASESFLTKSEKFASPPPRISWKKPEKGLKF